MNYLTEKSLGEALSFIFPNQIFIHNKKVPNSGINNRPDYRCEGLKLIVEFDGYMHYTDSRTQTRDINKISIYELMGYKVVNIPYFVQLSKETIKYYFDLDVDWIQTYPHGFIDSNCKLPADFNSRGIRNFRNQILNLPIDIRDEIMESLLEKIYLFNCPLMVLPVYNDTYEYDRLEEYIDEEGVEFDNEFYSIMFRGE